MVGRAIVFYKNATSATTADLGIYIYVEMKQNVTRKDIFHNAMKMHRKYHSGNLIQHMKKCTLY